MHAIPEIHSYLVVIPQLLDGIVDLVVLHGSVYEHGQVEAA